jgi:adenine phosphoribosyltransferase
VEEQMKRVEDYIITIPDFPKKGIMFRDITGVLEDADGLKLSIDELAKLIENDEFDSIAGTESRGFILGMPLAYVCHKPFVAIRKKGKLPRETVEQSYSLEYGEATIEMHKSSVKPGDRVVLVDDLIATGGTMEAAVKLIEKCGGKVVKIIALTELKGLKGRELLKGYDVATVVAYEGI